MSDLRDMELLAALARHGHFARAAEDCGISQPAFSARIRNLELELGVPIVKRGNRFLGFTAEGEVVLRWARRMLADADGLRQEIAAARGGLTGGLTVGVVPTALAHAARIPARMRQRHPGVRVRIASASSAEIRQGLEDFTLEAGITYLDAELPSASLRRLLYRERYVLLAPAALAPRATGTARWAEAARLPLCLLTPNMHNRRIVDDAFRTAGAEPADVTETNAFTAALVQVASGAAATIAPEALAESLIVGRGVVRLALTHPEVERPIGLVIADLDPMPPTVRVLLDALGGPQPR